MQKKKNFTVAFNSAQNDKSVRMLGLVLVTQDKKQYSYKIQLLLCEGFDPIAQAAVNAKGPPINEVSTFQGSEM